MYLIIGNIQQTSPSTSGSVWEIQAQANGTVTSTIRQESPNGGQRGTSIIGVFTPSTDIAGATVQIYASRLSGSASLSVELPHITIVPLPYLVH